MADCVGCGYCCIKVPCFVAQRLHGGGLTKCPHLEWTGERYTCQIMKGDSAIARRYREELAAGAGCCSGLNSWRKDVKPRRKEDDVAAIFLKKNPLPMELQLFARCLGTQFVSGDTIYLACCAMKRELIIRGWKESDAVEYVERILACFKGNRSSNTEQFMG